MRKVKYSASVLGLNQHWPSLAVTANGIIPSHGLMTIFNQTCIMCSHELLHL